MCDPHQHTSKPMRYAYPWPIRHTRNMEQYPSNLLPSYRLVVKVRPSSPPGHLGNRLRRQRGDFDGLASVSQNLHDEGRSLYSRRRSPELVSRYDGM